MPKGIYEPIGVGSGALGGGGGGGGGGGVAYYVNGSTGSDSNTGLSPSFPWKTITKVNASTFLPGEAVLFQGGQTFSGAIVSPSAGTPAAPITFGSYGGGQATISSGTSNGFTSTNQAGIIVRDLTFTGSASTNIGVHFNNTLGSNVHLQNIQVINCNVSGYGWSGIHVDGNNGSAGYDDVLIDGCSETNCCSVAQALANIGTSGIQVCSNTGYGLAVNAPSFNNVTIRKCLSTNNTGATDTNWTGSGFFVGQTNIGLIDDCTASGNGTLAINATGGPIGIWAADSVTILIRTSRSISNSSGNTFDGSGFGFDGGTKNGILEGCYSKGNFGCGYFLEGYTDGFVTANDGCAVINCTSENDGGGASSTNNASFVINNTGVLTNLRVLNSVAIQSTASTHVVFIKGSAQNSITGIIDGNTFIVSGTQEFVDTAGTPAIVFNGNRYLSGGAFNVTWNGTSFTSVGAWNTAFSTEENLSVINVGTLVASKSNANGCQIVLAAPDAAIEFNDTQTNGHDWLEGAAVNGSTPYWFFGYDNTARGGSGIGYATLNFGGNGELALKSSGVFAWTNNVNYAQAGSIDTGISRLTSNVIAVGDGSPADFTGAVNAAHGVFGPDAYANRNTSFGDVQVLGSGAAAGVYLQQFGIVGWRIGLRASSFSDGGLYFTAASNDPGTGWSLALANGGAVFSNTSFCVGQNTLATNATDGFFYVDTCAGTPTGTPTAHTGTVPMVYDTTGHILWIYDNGAWRQPKAATIAVTWQ